MAWVICPRCHFSQVPAAQCRRCGQALSAPPPGELPAPAPRRKATWAAAVFGAVLLAVVLLVARSTRTSDSAGPPPTAAPTAAPLDLSGLWVGQISKSLGANPPRPVLKEIAIETSRDGAIAAARVVFTDPGRGGAGAGYRSVDDGAARLARAASALAAQPQGAPLDIDFLSLPGWIPPRERVWKALEGAGRAAEPTTYLLVESTETDSLIQAGFNASGFLSYVFFSPAYAPRRGQDALSAVIHPEPGAALRGFRNLIWDLSGAADFLKLEVPVTISGPEGDAPEAATLRRSGTGLR